MEVIEIGVEDDDGDGGDGGGESLVMVMIGSRMMRIILEVCLRQQRRVELMDLPEFPSPGQSHLCANPQIWHCHTPPAWQCWQFGEN